MHHIPQDAERGHASHALHHRSDGFDCVEIPVDFEIDLHALFRAVSADFFQSAAEQQCRFQRTARFRNVVAEHADGGYAHPHADVDGFLGGGDVLFQLFLAVELAARAKAHDFKVVLL